MKEIISGIYAIENKANGKKYIGASKNILRRWLEHKSELNLKTHHNDYFQKSWNKYGEDGFYFYIIDRCSEDELEEFEKYYIKKFKTRDDQFGYNLSDGGSIKKNITISDKARKKISKAATGRIQTQEHKNKTSVSVSKSKIGIKKKNGNNENVGVYLNKSNISWLVRITFRKITHRLGNFKNKDNAIEAYQSACLFLQENFNQLLKINESEG